MSNKFKQAVAWSLVLTAIAVAVIVAGYLYLDTKYPTDIQYINSHLKVVSDGMRIDLEKARGAGYSDEEISGGLAKYNVAEFNYWWIRIQLTVGGFYVVILMCLMAIILLKINNGKDRAT